MRYHKTDKASPEERFWAKVQINNESECWPWLACVDQRNYGMFSIPKREGRTSHMIRSHRFSLELKEGRALESYEEACHTCDNPICCNPDHLFVGTHTDNMKDMIEKDRGNHTRKISKDKIEELINLRNEGYEVKEIAKMYGISSSHASRVTRGMTT